MATFCSLMLVAVVLISIYLIPSGGDSRDKPVAQKPESKVPFRGVGDQADQVERRRPDSAAVVEPKSTGETQDRAIVPLDSLVPTRKESKTESDSIENAGTDFPTLSDIRREPLPSENDQQNLRRIVATLFKTQYAAAATKASKIELAVKIVEAARDESDLSTKYVLLDIAKGIAIQNLDIELALSYAERIEQVFEVEAGSIVSTAVSGIAATLSKTASPDREVADEVMLLLVAFANNASVQGNAALAITWLEKAQIVAKMVGRHGQEARLGTVLKAVRAEVTYQSVLANAIQVLSSDPNNSDANLVVGKDFCMRGEWKEGFSRLRLSSEPEMKRLASMELEQGGGKETREKLGDLWWDYTSNDAKLVKLARERARHHYSAAIISAKGLEKLKIDSRLLQLPAEHKLQGRSGRSEEPGKNVTQGREPIDSRTPSTKGFLEEFIIVLQASVNEINELDTQVQRQAARGTFEEKLNKTLKGQLWAVQFPILDIAKLSQTGVYQLSLGFPFDLPKAPLQYQKRAIVKLSEARAMQVTEGKYAFEIVGRPSYSLNELNSHLVDLSSIGGGSVQLTNAKSRVVSVTSQIDNGLEFKKSPDAENNRNGIVLENGPVNFIPFFRDPTLPLIRSATNTDIHYRVENAGDKAIVHIVNALPATVKVGIDLSLGAGSKLERSGVNLQNLSSIKGAPQVIVTWADREITSVTWNGTSVPPMEEVEPLTASEREPITYNLPPIGQDAMLYRKALTIVEAQIEWTRKNKAPEGYVILEKELIDGHDCSALLPLRIVYGPIIARRNNALVIIGEKASVIFDAGVGADGVERIVVTQLKHAIGQLWEGDPLPTKNDLKSTTYVTEKNEMKPGRFIEDQ